MLDNVRWLRPLALALALAFVVLCGAALVLYAQPRSPVLQPPLAGARVVQGIAAPSAAPITIVDVSASVPVTLGSGIEMDTAGHFAVSVDPPLRAGQTIIAVDAEGQASVPALVQRAGAPAAQP